MLNLAKGSIGTILGIIFHAERVVEAGVVKHVLHLPSCEPSHCRPSNLETSFWPLGREGRGHV